MEKNIRQTEKLAILESMRQELTQEYKNFEYNKLRARRTYALTTLENYGKKEREFGSPDWKRQQEAFIKLEITDSILEKMRRLAGDRMLKKMERMELPDTVIEYDPSIHKHSQAMHERLKTFLTTFRATHKYVPVMYPNHDTEKSNDMRVSNHDFIDGMKEILGVGDDVLLMLDGNRLRFGYEERAVQICYPYGEFNSTAIAWDFKHADTMKACTHELFQYFILRRKKRVVTFDIKTFDARIYSGQPC